MIIYHFKNSPSYETPYYMVEKDGVTAYYLGKNGEVVKDWVPMENLLENGKFPPLFLEIISIEDIPAEIQEQIEYDLDA